MMQETAELCKGIRDVEGEGQTGRTKGEYIGKRIKGLAGCT